MTPSIPDGLFTKPGMKCIERYSQALRPCLFTLCVRWPLIEERALLCISSQPSHAHGHLTETDSTTEASLKERREVRRYVHFPTRFPCQPLLFRDFELIAIPDRERHAPTHTPLIPQRATEPLHGIEQCAPEHQIIHLIWL